MKNGIKFALFAALAVACAFAFAGHPLVDPSVIAGLGMIPMAIGEVSPVSEIKSMIEAQGKTWDAYKEANDARLKAIEAKTSTADIDAKLQKMNDEFVEQQKTMREIEKRVNRPGAGASGDAPTQERIEHRKAFNLFMRKGHADGLVDLQRKAMQSGSDPDGGYLVIPEMDNVIDRIAPTISAMYRLANVVTIGTAKYEKLVKKSGMAMRRVADGATGGETTEPTYAKIGIEVFTAEVEPWVYNETLQDAFIDLEADLADEAGIGFAEGAGAEFITGNGVGKARGIAAYTNVVNSSYTWGNVGFIRAGKTTAFMSVAPADRVVDLQHALKAQYRPGAVWMLNDSTLAVMRQIKDASGSYYLWNPDPTAGFGGRFLGSPVEVDDNFADIASASISLAYLNPKRAYTIVNRQGTTLLRDPYTGKGVVKFNFRRRFGGGIVNYEAVKLMVFSTGASGL